MNKLLTEFNIPTISNRKNPVIIYITGNTNAGKSTLLHNLLESNSYEEKHYIKSLDFCENKFFLCKKNGYIKKYIKDPKELEEYTCVQCKFPFYLTINPNEELILLGRYITFPYLGVDLIKDNSCIGTILKELCKYNYHIIFEGQTVGTRIDFMFNLLKDVIKENPNYRILHYILDIPIEVSYKRGLKRRKNSMFQLNEEQLYKKIEKLYNHFNKNNLRISNLYKTINTDVQFIKTYNIKLSEIKDYFYNFVNNHCKETILERIM